MPGSRGTLRRLTLGDLPAISEDAQLYSRVVSRPEGAMPQVPAGFSVELVASGLDVPRVIRVAPNGDLFLAESGANRVRVLRLASGSNKLSKNEIFASGLRQPYGIAFYPEATIAAAMETPALAGSENAPVPAGTST